MRPDIAVIGGGAAGLGAALAARSAGCDVVMIERDRVGGECTWTGCVPTKHLTEAAQRAHVAARTNRTTTPPDAAGALRAARDVAARIGAGEDADALARIGVRVVAGHARFTAPGVLDVEGTTVRAGATIVATGSRPVLPRIPGLAACAPLTTDDVVALEDLPARVAVLGGGASGVELAQAMARLGSAVTVVETAPRLLPTTEPETGATLAAVLRDEGVVVHTGTRIDSCESGADGVTLRADGVSVARADRVLVAAGRRARSDDLDLARGGVDTTADGAIRVDRRMRTSAPGTYAIGDVTTWPRVTHAAYRMGQIAVHDARHRIPWRFRPEALPLAVFTDPEVGTVGLTEAQAHARWGDAARVAHREISATDRARIAGGRDAGFVKLVAAPHPVTRGALGGRLVGATVVCPGAGDVIGELALAVRARMLLARVARTVHPYPSWSLAVWEAAGQFFGAHTGTARPARP